MLNRPLLIFDGNCGFCGIWIAYWKLLTAGRIDYAPYQEVGPEYPQIAQQDFAKAVQLVRPDLSVTSGADAVFETLAYSPNHQWMVWLYRHVPGLPQVANSAYRFIAAHRNFFYQATRLTFGTNIQPARYQLIEWLFLKALALIFLVAFVSFGLQSDGLIGSHGILPVGPYFDSVHQTFGTAGYWMLPSVLWLSSSDAVIRWVCIGGGLASFLLFLGFAPRTCLAILFIFYLSLCSAGQDFMSFQWDMLLLESAFLAMFLGTSRIVIWLFRWLLFRLMFLSGAVKLLSHDPAWRSLDALRFHYWTQPLPTPLAWYMDQAPASFQRASTAVVFVIELLVPFLIFFPRRIRFVAAGLLVTLQLLIFATGNYTFFNLLSLALCLFLLDDRAFHRFPQPREKVRKLRPRIALAVAVLIAVLSGLQLLTTFFGPGPWPGQGLLSLAAPFGIVNSYGLFAAMTTTRPEIIVEGSNDGVSWVDYEFKYKPGNPARAPRWVAPYQPRLDWQMWFAALSDWRNSPWFVGFVHRLLEGSAPVTALLERNPFPNAPPKYIRARLFQYRFTRWTERSQTGNWWKRDPAGLYFPPISLDAFKPER